MKVMTTAIAAATLMGIVALGAARADAGQATPPVPPFVDAAVETAIEVAIRKAEVDLQRFEFDMRRFEIAMQKMAIEAPFAQLAAPQPPKAPTAPRAPLPPKPFAMEAPSDSLYRQGREHIDAGQYDSAIQFFERLVGQNSERADAALYWKAYSLSKLSRRDDALATLADLEKRFAKSGWLKDAKALEMQVRQASGQAVSPDAQTDEELKLLALRGLMQSDPERAVPMIETLLAGSSSIRVKENALFVLSQSRTAQARTILAGVAKGGNNPDLQLRAIRYLGAMGGADNQQILDEAYRASSDAAVKRAILRGFMTSGDRARLLALAKTETSPELRGEAIQQLGVMSASTELTDLYRTEPSVDMKKKIVQSIFVSGNAKALVDLARPEKNMELKRDIVSKLSMMKSKDATDYLLELLK